jgi:hypothetical protein
MEKESDVLSKKEKARCSQRKRENETRRFG